jgi:hypothetical protein
MSKMRIPEFEPLTPDTGTEGTETTHPGDVASVAGAVRGRIGKLGKVLKNCLRSGRGFMFSIALSQMMHIPLMFPNATETTIMSVINGSDSKYKKQFKIDYERIKARNGPRLRNIENNKESADSFKKDLADRIERGEDVLDAETFFQMEVLSQGVDIGVVNEARTNFYDAIKKLESEKPAVPDKEFLQKVMAIFTPAEAYEGTRSSAVDSLAMMGQPGTQNCDARAKILIMALSALYPEMKDGLLTQYFRDHVRVLFQVGEKTYVMDGYVHLLEEDSAHTTKTTLITKSKNMIKGYAGLEVKEKEVVDRGPLKDKPYIAITDNVLDYNIQQNEDLGYFSDEESVYGGTEGKPEEKLKENDARVEMALGDISEKWGRPFDLLLIDEKDFLVNEVKEANEKHDAAFQYRQREISKEGLQTLGGLKGYILVLDDLTTLDAASAIPLEQLGKNVQVISLKGLKSLDPETAEVLVRAGENPRFISLSLNGLTSLDPETAGALARLGEKAPPVPRGQQDWGHLSLDGLTALDVETAKNLTAFKRLISLNGLRTLDPSTAAVLAHFKASYLLLEGLQSIDGATAKALLKFKGKISLKGLKTIDAEAAAALSVLNYYTSLNLSGLTHIDADTAAALAGFKGESLNLSGLKSIDKDTAAALAGFKGEFLDLSGLKSIDKDTAEALAKSQVRFISLASIFKIDQDTVKILKKSPAIFYKGFGEKI